MADTPIQSGPTPAAPVDPEAPRGAVGRLIDLALGQKLVVLLLTVLIIGWGLAVAPFDWDLRWLPRSPVPVDAIPDLGENQQIVFAEWAGRSPRDVEDQLTYPLTVQLLGVPGVREVRSTSMFGFSTIALIFEEDVEFYWARGRILERLASLPAGALPEGVQPQLGPDATGLGQVLWYTLEGRDPDGNPTGGWDLHTLRGIQDWYVRYALQSAEGVSEVASVGGHVQEYQVDVDPDAMRIHGVTLSEVVDAVRRSNLDVGARTTEINQVEYVVRGVGFVRDIADIESSVVRTGTGHVPIRVVDVATVGLGPALRRGALTNTGAETVGGVVTVRYGYNPLLAIRHVKERIEAIRPGLPTRAVVDWSRVRHDEVTRFAEARGFSAFASAQLNQPAWLDWLRTTPREEWPAWITTSQIHIEPFYDRTGLIHETLGTLEDALVQQILVTILVVLLMVVHLRSSLVVSAMLPLAVLMGFIAMKLLGVEANLVSLAGIAIAIGTIVDMGVIVTENVLRHLDRAPADAPRLPIVSRATREVGSAVTTAIATTVIGFLPVFTMTGAEGKLFVPLAYTKTAVMIAAVLLALTVVPVAAWLLLGRGPRSPSLRTVLRGGLTVAALIVAAAATVAGWRIPALVALSVATASGLGLLLPVWIAWLRASAGARGGEPRWLRFLVGAEPWIASLVVIVAVGLALALVWEPLGPELGTVRNILFVFLLAGGVIGLFRLILFFYAPILAWCLAHKAAFLAIPLALIVLGATVSMGFDTLAAPFTGVAERAGLATERLRHSRPWVFAVHAFPGMTREFMPPLDEGSFLWMPTTMPHASIGEALDVMKKQDLLIASVPEVARVVGKLGRAETALDPAPISMFETVIEYHPEYVVDGSGRRLAFAYDRRAGAFLRDEAGDLVPDPRGRPYRQWRDHIRSPDDIWAEIVAAAHIPGTTSAPKLQPIETRLVMLQTGMRAPMGVKVRGPDLERIEATAIAIERLLRDVPYVDAATVSAERVVGKPYLELVIDRAAIARHGLRIQDVQEVIATAIGGQTVTTTVEGRERYPVRVRFARELRDTPEAMQRVVVPAPDGSQVPLEELAEVRYVRGPQMIRAEDTFPVAYVTFGGVRGRGEVDVVAQARAYLDEMVHTGKLRLPDGVSYTFAGTYEHQVRATRTLLVVLPVALMLIFIVLYLQFRSVPTTAIVFFGIFVAWGGGFVALWLFGQDWFGDFELLGANMRELFRLHAVSLSVAVWVGFLALFGIAVDDGVVMATYLDQRFGDTAPATVTEIREATIEGGLRRARPCLMTTATTLLALMPVLTATGRGADLMIPMALPTVGGMSFVVITMFTVPVLYSLVAELRLPPGAPAATYRAEDTSPRGGTS
jgi:copper/silver efflux system protein